ncbi:MAG: sugar phosphate isomerase/epimerase [Verrucomicrobia bacterium]|nr:MAG: sugar phosphate isomerase/epimerase [Verrucomicrobiota bacterium]
MRIGVNAFLFSFPFTNEGTVWFKTFKRWGFDCVEIPVDNPDGIDPEYVRAELDKAGLPCATVCGMFGLDRDLRGDAQAQKNSIDYLKKCIDYAVILGAHSVIGPVYSAVGRVGGAPPKERARQWKLVVRNLKKVCRYAEKKGIRICLEPLNRFETDFINTCEQGLQMIKDVGSPALKLHLDTFHMNIEEKFQPKAIRKAGRHLGHLHACGCDRGTPGKDHIDWPGIGAALKAIRYDGDVVIESFSHEMEMIATAAAIWRPIEKSPEVLARGGLRFLRKALA